jgi:N-acetylglucosamine-6-phosphate deacetylase
MRLTFKGAHLVDAASDIPTGEITIEGSRLVAVGRGTRAAGKVVDATDAIIMPGFIDVHTHGGGGFNLHSTDPSVIHAYARWAPQTGVTSFLIGVVGTPDSLPEEQLRAATTACAEDAPGAQPLGIHLEGPYISSARRGAHMLSWLRSPNSAEAERLLAVTGGALRLVTLAPELPGAEALIRRLVAAGVTVSIGHTDATYEQTLGAITLGVTHATHCCNAMRPMLHRDPGPLGALAQMPTVLGELIADGVHVHPAVMNVVIKALGPDRTIIITDALATAGMPEGPFDFAGQPAQVVHGAARLLDGTLTGSVLTMAQALRNTLDAADVTLSQAAGMLTRNPARAARVADRKGSLTAGFDADLVILDANLTVQATLCRGELAYATDAWRDRLADTL